MLVAEKCQSNPFFDKTTKIVNGQEVERGSWPFIVTLLNADKGASYPERQMCGGSVLSATRVLTAAHCVVNEKGDALLEGLQVIVGEHDLNSMDGPERLVNVNCIKKHPKYNHKTGEFDFAILEVDDMQLDGNERSVVCLPGLNEHVKPMNGKGQQQCYVAGWGNTDYDSGDPSEKLLSVRLDVFTDAYCKANSKHNFNEFVKGWMPADGSSFCAGRRDVKKDSCQGDSGGPMVCVVNGVAIQYGVVSWGIECANKNYPGLYGMVAAEINWITTAVGKSSKFLRILL